MRSASVVYGALVVVQALGSLACKADRSPGAPAAHRSPSTISQAEVRASIDAFVCARWSAEVKEWSLELLADDCPTERPGAGSDAIHGVVHDAVRATRPLVMLGARAYDGFYAAVAARPSVSQAEADGLATAAFWADPVLSGALLLRVRLELAGRGWSCEDCPLVATPEPVRLRWEEFFPFLSAYVWPVRSEQSSEIDVFVCSALNGAANLPDSTAARQAGFLAAASFASDERRARELGEMKGAYNRSQGPTVAGMRRQIDDYLASPEVRRHVCAAVEDVAWFTGVILEGCDAAGEAVPT
jgi:hypothetical protein